MNGNLENSDMAALITEAGKIGHEADATFGPLSHAQLNWKRNADEWSVGQCLEHLILTNRPYFPLFERIAAGNLRKSFWESVPLLPSMFGRLLLGAVNPESARKVKARKAFIPAASDVDAQIVGQFVHHQDELVSSMKALMALPVEKIIITSPVASVVTYSVLDGCRIIVTHERRHFRQAERVMASEEFPRA